MPGVTTGAYLDLYDGIDCPVKNFHECKDCEMSKQTKMSRLHLRDEVRPPKTVGKKFEWREDGWEPVMIVDGRQRTFLYDSTYWTNNQGYNDDDDFTIERGT